MLTKEQNELLTRTGPGTPMGDVLRRYWVPAVMSSEVAEPDCPPAKVKLLGEDLIAFRDTKGRVGIVQERCAHRTASLWLGRNEDCGIRCVFHGWKFDIEGRCVDMPNEPTQDRLRDKVRIRAYPTAEMGDIVWAYMGPADKMPAPPKFEFTQVPPSHREVTKTLEECNWFQAVEGGIDTSHVGFLHFGSYQALQSTKDPTGFWRRSQAPHIEVDLTTYGYRYAGVRPLGDQGHWVRGYHFVMPWTQIRPSQANTKVLPNGEKKENWTTTVSGHFWVPQDDESCMVWNWAYNFGNEGLSEEDRRDDAAGPENVYVDQNFRKKRNKDNNWMIDRAAQRTSSFTGIKGINTQDHAVQESMGPIMDRTVEHLGPADMPVVMARRLLFEAVEAVRAGKDPLGVSEGYYELRAIEKLLQTAAWRNEMLPLMYPQSAGAGSDVATRRSSAAE
jgi:phenylpropionate dioxygenase-like ring-hydroxylating dioxygenase large terminal subunit